MKEHGGRRKKGLSFLGSTSSMKGPAQREPSRTSAPSAKNICPITTSDKIVATPTLIKVSPAPVQKIIGDLSEEAKVLLALGLQQGTT